MYEIETREITLLISLSYQIQCNCDNHQTTLPDDNVLMSKDQLPVKGKVLHNSGIPYNMVVTDIRSVY